MSGVEQKFRVLGKTGVEMPLFLVPGNQTKNSTPMAKKLPEVGSKGGPGLILQNFKRCRK